MPPSAEPSFEIAEFSAYSERDMYPYTTFVNHLFIYPQSLSFESQKLFSRARNLGLTIEVRDSDADGAKAIPVISFNHRYFALFIAHHNYILIKLIICCSASMVDQVIRCYLIKSLVPCCTTIQIQRGMKR